MREGLPTGTVTFLFTDIESSTRLLHELGAEAYADALGEHRRVIREACAAEGGVEVDTQGDAFFFAFPTASGALAAASAFTEALASGPIHVRVGLHTGTPLLAEEGYVGVDTHRAARIAAAGHGGQVLVSSSTAELVDFELADLGEHRLKDLAAPERVFQLGDGEFSALKSLYRTNLPIPATTFLGREQELAEVLSLLSSEDTRLLTLTGPGGTGKTRLALQAVAEASDRYPDGVWWIPLAPLREPALVLETAAQVVGSKNGLAEHIADRSMLCLFDNFEQVVEAGTELASLLASCPNLDFVVTSRERLRVSGEQTYPVPPLAQEDGEALFIARARAVDPSFASSEAVGKLCLRLDELPLALELAAARTALFSPEQLLERLAERLDLLRGDRDADPRQQTLRATIEWSYDLLSREEQDLFARLSVFASGCSYEAAERVADAGPDTLQSLLDKSLLRRRASAAGPRYWMLETIREYAAEKLEESGEADELRKRHADHFLALAAEVGGGSYGGLLPLAVNRLAHESDNFRASIEWALDRGRYEVVLRFGWELWMFWILRNHAAEGRRLLEVAIAAGERETDAWLWGALALSELERVVGDPERARAMKEELLPRFREKDDTRAVASTLADLGDLAMESGDYQLAHRLLEESLSLRPPDAHASIGRTLSSIGDLALHEGDYELAETILQDAVDHHAVSDSEGANMGFSLEGLAEARRRQNDYVGAERALRDALRIKHGLGDVVGAAGTLESLAEVALERGHEHRAGRLVGAAGALREATGADPAGHRTEIAVPLDARTEGAALGFDEAVAYALAID